MRSASKSANRYLVKGAKLRPTRKSKPIPMMRIFAPQLSDFACQSTPDSGACGAMAHEKATRGNPCRAVGVLSRCAAKQRCPVVSQVKRQNQTGKCHLPELFVPAAKPIFFLNEHCSVGTGNHRKCLGTKPDCGWSLGALLEPDAQGSSKLPSFNPRRRRQSQSDLRRCLRSARGAVSPRSNRSRAWTGPDRRPIQHDLGALDVKIRSHGSADWGFVSGGALHRE